jgi:hypothetical protein
MLPELNPERALIFRIVHRDNLPWILGHGVHCRNSQVFDPQYVNIGNPDLIDKRHGRTVSHAPGGTLSDYVPFYFTPLSPMLLNIKTGYNGIKKRDNTEIVIMVSSIPHLEKNGIPYLFTDRHAYLVAAKFSNDPADLSMIDWGILQNRDFKRDPEDLGKVERYQAEALVHESAGVNGLLGFACCNPTVRDEIQGIVDEHGVQLKVLAKGGWYF